MEVEVSVVKMIVITQDNCTPVSFEQRHEKTFLWGLRPGKIQTGLFSFRDSYSFEIVHKETRDILSQQTTKALISLRGCAG